MFIFFCQVSFLYFFIDNRLRIHAKNNLLYYKKNADCEIKYLKRFSDTAGEFISLRLHEVFKSPFY